MRWMMPVEEILKLYSYDSKDHKETVAEVIPDKELDWFHDLIALEMWKAEINMVPIVVLGDLLYDGHHRLKIAMELGHEEMLVSDNVYDADGNELVKYEVVA